jgi:hypothetical protein
MHKNSDKFKILAESLKILKSHPLLFAPKLIIALLYGVTTLLSVSVLNTILEIVGSSVTQLDYSSAQQLLFSALVLIVLTCFTYFLDIFFSGLYPVLVEQARSGRVSFIRAFGDVRSKLFVLFSSGIVIWVLMFIISFAEAMVIQFFSFSQWAFIASFIVGFVFIFFFYFLYPIIAFKKFGVISSINSTIASSLSNKKRVFVYSLIPFVVSIIKFTLAFFSGNPYFLVVFWVLTIITGLVYTVHVVINQLLYSQVSKN